MNYNDDGLSAASLSEMQGPSALSDEEISVLRRKAWQEMGLLIVFCSDRRLTPNEANIVRQIAERIYGGQT